MINTKRQTLFLIMDNVVMKLTQLIGLKIVGIMNVMICSVKIFLHNYGLTNNKQLTILELSKTKQQTKRYNYDKQ